MRGNYNRWMKDERELLEVNFLLHENNLGVTEPLFSVDGLVGD